MKIINSIQALFIVLFTILAILLFKRSSRYNKDSLGISGKLIWVDKSNKTKPFFNNIYQIVGKPDLIYKTKKGYLAVEYKNRYGKIYLSDIVQAKCAALAARGSGYNITHILLKTKKKEEYYTLPNKNSDLYKEVEPYILLSRQAKSGKAMDASPNKFKCLSCAFNYKCVHAKSK